MLNKPDPFKAKGKSKERTSFSAPRRASAIGGQCEFPLCNGRNGIPMLILNIKHKKTGWNKQFWVCAKTMRESPTILLTRLDVMDMIPLQDWALNDFKIDRLIKYADGRIFPWQSDMINTRHLRR